MENADPPSRLLVHHHPLVPAAVLFLAGMIGGRFLAAPVGVVVAAAGVMWIAWVVAEFRRARRRAVGAMILLGGAISAAGCATWQLNQYYGERTHLARFVPAQGEIPVTVRLRVLVAPDSAAGGGGAHGDAYWLGRVTELLTENGWISAAGDVTVQWRAGEGAALERGQSVEAYGWASRPLPALNPGAINPRAMLAADRVFTILRVPRAGGIIARDATTAGSTPSGGWLTRMRLYLRGRFLEHTLREDVPAALTLQALLLGYRDPAIADVSKAFADAGVAHLLAISGSHIVFFTGLIWGLLRFIPMRPRWREILIAAVVGLYVLATPCGPPIVRAAVALVVVVLSRLLGRPRQLMNMLAAAALVVVLLRPADIADAGCQLSFVSTFGLILFGGRLHAALFGRMLERQRLISDLAETWFTRFRYRTLQLISGMTVANIIGAGTAAPLVAYHFGQVNLLAPVTGIIALPVVSLGMVVAALQLVAELCWSPLGMLLSPVSGFTGRGMVWLVGALARVPGSVLAVRAPPFWVAAVLYAAILVWGMRRRIGISRALTANVALAALTLTVAWYALTVPVGGLEMQVLSVGQGSSILMRAPDGRMWAINAGSQDRGSILRQAIEPALRSAGERRLAGVVLTSLDPAHARAAGDLAAEFRPTGAFVSVTAWRNHGFTLAGAELEGAAARVGTLQAGQALQITPDCRLTALWADGGQRGDLILLCEFAGRRVLIVDPTANDALELAQQANPDWRCDVVIFAGPERGAADEALRRRIAPLAAREIIWSGRGPWAGRTAHAAEFNSADGTVTLTMDATGIIRISR